MNYSVTSTFLGFLLTSIFVQVCTGTCVTFPYVRVFDWFKFNPKTLNFSTFFKPSPSTLKGLRLFPRNQHTAIDRKVCMCWTSLLYVLNEFRFNSIEPKMKVDLRKMADIRVAVQNPDDSKSEASKSGRLKMRMLQDSEPDIREHSWHPILFLNFWLLTSPFRPKFITWSVTLCSSPIPLA